MGPKAPEGALTATPPANGHPTIPGEAPRPTAPGRGLGTARAAIAEVVARVLEPARREAVLEPVRPHAFLRLEVTEGAGRPTWRLRAPPPFPVKVLLTPVAP